MNATFQRVLIISAKNAVNAILTNASLAAMLPKTFTVFTAAGLIAMVKVCAAVVASREAMVWIPKLLAWSQSNGNAQP